MLKGANKSIFITGYSLSEYFKDMINCIIEKSQRGILVKFYVNDIKNQDNIKNLYRYKGRFLKIYNYPKLNNDTMTALHAKVISVDGEQTLITPANLSYYGQQSNIEIGTLIQSKKIAKQVEDIFTRLFEEKVFTEV